MKFSNYIKLISIFFLCLICSSFYGQTLTYTASSSTAGTGTWTVPCGVTSITVQCIGAGGSGGGGNNNGGVGCGGGGGGGAYTFSNAVTVVAGSSYNFTVGTGGFTPGASDAGVKGGDTKMIIGTTTVTAVGGSGGGLGTSGTAGAGGTGTYNGGSGVAGINGTRSGGGGEAASASGAGNNASGLTGGNGTAGANGGDGQNTTNTAGGNGSSPGGGGGGGTGNKWGGDGGAGKIVIIYTQTTADAGADQSLGCTTTTATLAGNTPPTGFTGLWTKLSGTGSITTSTLSTSSVTGLTIGAPTVFQWALTYSTGCTSVDNVTITPQALCNDNCADATVLTINGSLLCSQNTSVATSQGGECITNFSPYSNNTTWYRFTATNDSLVYNFLVTKSASFTAALTLYGPFASGAGCSPLPACASSTYTTFDYSAVDRGQHKLITGLATTGNRDYLIQIDTYNNNDMPYCISIADPAINSFSGTRALNIDQCGITYNGTTNGGYIGVSRNLDANAATEYSLSPSVGGDVSFAVNNVSWFKFCSVNTGTYNVQFNVSNCVFTGASSGGQMALLTGLTSSLTNKWQAANPTTTATATQTSPNFSLAASGCAYLVVDGYAGDACDYSYVLTNVSGGCSLLPIELLSFNALQQEKEVLVSWATATEKNNDYFTIERSEDGKKFIPIEIIDAAGISSNVLFYNSVDRNPLFGTSYYRLRQTDFNGDHSYSKVISVDFENSDNLKFEIIPNPKVDNYPSYIKLNNIYDGDLAINITDLRGVVVYENLINGKESKIEMPTTFSSGIYFVKITSDKMVQTKRMVIN